MMTSIVIFILAFCLMTYAGVSVIAAGFLYWRRKGTGRELLTFLLIADGSLAVGAFLAGWSWLAALALAAGVAIGLKRHRVLD